MSAEVPIPQQSEDRKQVEPEKSTELLLGVQFASHEVLAEYFANNRVVHRVIRGQLADSGKNVFFAIVEENGAIIRRIPLDVGDTFKPQQP